MGGMVSGLTEAIGGAFEAEASHKANQRQLERDQLAADIGARQAQEKGSYEAGQIRQQVSQLNAKQRMAYANSGVDATEGTAAQVQANTAAQGELDAKQVKNNAAREVWGYQQVKKQNYEDFDARKDAITRKGAVSLAGGAGQFGQGVMQLFGGS